MAVDRPRRSPVRRPVSAGHNNRRRAFERRLGYSFNDSGLLDRALTHPSAVSGRGAAGQLDAYQRLEFLGDRVLGLIIADMLMDAFPTADEGDLHRRHASLVRKETCASVGAELGLGEALRLGDSEEVSGGRSKETILGDACESVIGAVYQDGGLEPARAVIDRYWRERMAVSHQSPRDAKSTLQEWAQALGLPVPLYEVTTETGPKHAPHFIIRVDLEGLASEDGEGPSKREAEQEAATEMLVSQGVWAAPAK